MSSGFQKIFAWFWPRRRRRLQLAMAGGGSEVVVMEAVGETGETAGGQGENVAGDQGENVAAGQDAHVVGHAETAAGHAVNTAGGTVAGDPGEGETGETDAEEAEETEGTGETDEPDEGEAVHETRAWSLPVELKYLDELIRYRIGQVLYPKVLRPEPVMPDCGKWELPIGQFLVSYNGKNDPLGKDEQRVLLLALVHHVLPDLFDYSIGAMLKGDTEFPRIGGFRGKNFRGFIPTGETAIFLLAGGDWKRGLALQELFWPNHPFVAKKILWLGEVEPGEPTISGKLILSQDYIDMLAHNKVVPPHHSAQFPAEMVSTTRSRGELVVSEKVNTEFDHLLEWFHLRETVENEWKGRKKGYRCLFYGPSGTGKTFTTCLLGKEAGKEVYRVDLSMIISKYIGETERNLELVFTRAEHKDWILFFDEADALFGKRTNIRDAHDKYANQEVSYLLQRIEQYDGLVVLATNMRGNIDDALRRRFEVELEFTMPNAVQRREIWKNSFPAGAIFRRESAGGEARSGEVGSGAAGSGEVRSGEAAARVRERKPVYYRYGKRNEEALKEEETVTANLPLDIPELVKGYRLSGASIENVVHYSVVRAVNRRDGSGVKTRDVKEADAMEVGEKVRDVKAAGPMVIYYEDVITGINRELRKNGVPLK